MSWRQSEPCCSASTRLPRKDHPRIFLHATIRIRIVIQNGDTNMPKFVDTGRVKIGSAYAGRRYIELDPDMLAIQAALTSRPTRSIDWDGIAIVLGTLVLAGVWLVPHWVRGLGGAQ